MGPGEHGVALRTRVRRLQERPMLSLLVVASALAVALALPGGAEASNKAILAGHSVGAGWVRGQEQAQAGAPARTADIYRAQHQQHIWPQRPSLAQALMGREPLDLLALLAGASRSRLQHPEEVNSQEPWKERDDEIMMPAPERPKRRGACLFHAGLAHNCDYRDVVGAVNEVSHWGSEMGPGKRKRRRKRSNTVFVVDDQES